jgi:hypothetical protein
MEEKNQQDRFLGVDREWGDDPEGRVKVEGASQEYEFSSEESEGEENNREAKHDPPDSRSPEGRVKGEGESRGYEFSSEESEGEEDNSTSTGTLNITPLDSLSTVTVPSSSSSVTQFPILTSTPSGPFQVVLGTHLFTVEIYVAPIEEDMLLGLDFLEATSPFSTSI